MVDQQAPDEIGSDRTERPRRELCDVLAVGVLAAVTLRIVASLATGAIRVRTDVPALPSTGAAHVADLIYWFADFGDGYGVLFAAMGLGLVWWQVYSVPRSSSPVATSHTRRSVSLCTWTTAVFATTAAASVAYGVAEWIGYWDDPERWMRIADSGFYVSYAVIGVLGMYATRQLFWRALLLAPKDGSET